MKKVSDYFRKDCMHIFNMAQLSMRTGTVIKAMIAKEFTVAFRYKLELVSGFIFLLATLMGIIFGGKQILGDESSESSVLAMLSSFLLFFFTNLCIGNPSNECKNAINEGNIETISMFSIPLYGYLSLQTFFNMLANIGTFVLVGIIASFILKIKFISANMLILIPFYFISLLGGLGIGLMLAGLQILYKKISYVISLSTIAISFVLAILPQTDNIFVELIPMKAFTTMFKDVVVDKKFPDISSMVAVLISSVVFYLLGIWVFNNFLKKAKIKGCLGGY
jgi:ABC-type polysaccharide/polyol phosphate export permease